MEKSAGKKKEGAAPSLVFLAAPIFVVIFLALMVVPIRPELLDLLLIANLGVALLVVFLATSISRPTEFSVFPSLLLMLTLGRLSLNVASTRMILTDGKNFGGAVIQAFGQWVVGGNYIVGAVIFLILVVIQFLVVTKGAERVAEVAARFRLEALPMKQMGIESSLSSGLIDEAGAALARDEIQQEIDFYGAMDGASKFIKGETMASVFIVVINVLGGIGAGMLAGGFSSFGQLFETYTLLTIGDGLVGLIPSLLVSLAAGIIITRSSSSGHLSHDLASQLGREPNALAMALGVLAGLMLIFGLFSGVAPVPFLLLGSSLAYGAWTVHQWEEEPEKEEMEKEETQTVGLPLGEREQMEVLLSSNIWEKLEPSGSIDRLRALTAKTRTVVFRRCGLPLSPVTLSESSELAQEEYVVLVRNEEIYRGRLRMGEMLALAPMGRRCPIEGKLTSGPGGRGLARWITSENVSKAQEMGLRVLDLEGVIDANVRHLAVTHAAELFGLQELDEIRRGVADNLPAVARALDEANLDNVILLEVMRSLLDEEVSVRNAPTIFEAIVHGSRATKDPSQLAELARHELRRQISRHLADDEQVIRTINLAPELEEELREALYTSDDGVRTFGLPPDRAMLLLDELKESAKEIMSRGHRPVLVVPSGMRRELFYFCHRYIPSLHILSITEIHDSCSAKMVDRIALPFVEESQIHDLRAVANDSEEGVGRFGRDEVA